MPNTDIQNPTAGKFNSPQRWATRLSLGTTAPASAAEASDVLTAMRVVQSAGGQALDYADLEWKVLAPLVNRAQPANFTRMIDVLAPTTESQRLALGDYVGETEAVDGSEQLTAQSQLRGYHFGKMFEGQRWWNPVTSADVTVDKQPIFNPRIDGKILPNRSDFKRDDLKDAFLWLHAEAGLTAESRAVINQTPELWTLKDAVLAMCWVCNGSEEFVLNPLRADLAILDNSATLEAVTLPFGQHLQTYLDRLLQPLGYNWHVDYDTGTVIDPPTTDAERNDKKSPQLRFFQKGIGDEKELYFQPPSSVLNLNDSNCNKYRISRRIGDSVNSVRVLGAPEQAEITMELVRGWPVSDDSLTATDLDKSEDGSQYKTKPNVWRLWVGNEAGDYTGSRTDITTTPDLSSVFSKWIPHRRNILDPFTFQGEAGDKQRRQIYLEYSINAGVKWLVAPTTFGQPFVLPDQIGVLFQGDQPPTELIKAGADARIRITGVVAGDARLIGEAPRQTHAVNGRDVPLELDVAQKFRKDWVQTTGDFKSQIAGDAAGEDTVDDTAAITAYAEKMRDGHEAAEVDCAFELPGIHLEYKIGDLITKINGREISLDQASSTAPTPRYVQVVKRTFTSDPPSTILTVDRGAKR